MISKFDLSKALRNQAVIVAAANDYTLVANGEAFTPDVNSSHIVESVLYGDDNSIGLADNSSSISFGIYQLSVHSPKTQSKYVGLAIVDVLQTSFSKGLELTSNSQMVRIKTASLSPMMETDTHLIHHLSLDFTVIN